MGSPRTFIEVLMRTLRWWSSSFESDRRTHLDLWMVCTLAEPSTWVKVMGLCHHVLVPPRACMERGNPVGMYDSLLPTLWEQRDGNPHAF